MKSARARSRQKIKFEFKASIGENSPVKAKAKLTKTKKLATKFSIKINLPKHMQWITIFNGQRALRALRCGSLIETFKSSMNDATSSLA